MAWDTDIDYSDFPLYYRIYRKICRFFSGASRIMVNVLFAVIVLFLIASYVFGLKVEFVMSPSMELRIRTYQFVLGKKVTDDTVLMTGDVCTYQPYGRNITITHRIIGRTKDGYVFKGDNNDTQDPEAVKKEQILYRLIWY